MVPGVDDSGLNPLADPSDQAPVLMTLQVLGIALFQHAGYQVVPEMTCVIAKQVVLVQRPPVSQLFEKVVKI